ncbi:hypothetical protein SPICUR_05785 [Spiribacter curvatus]|uniref:Diguanylate cyclase n=1 Tax=Spiribacter curvatus TaxID=1335757 RepID=U5T3Z0_9GAMM|nr:EAL domain-containing protein [Spiribacter curvatus]AGY92130.1 hypothetical protein SPICUR_05785 [Spiribacter curvatus]
MMDAQTILIVDDDPTIRLMTSAGLGKQGYQTVLATDVDTAIEQVISASPDLVLASVSLAERDGFDFIEAVRAGSAGTVNQDKPILVLTALSDVTSINRAFAAGATDFITKPVNLTILAERVKYSLAAAARATALRDAQMEQASACRMARLGFWRLDLTTSALSWSDGAEAILGCARLPDTREALISLTAGHDSYRLEEALNTAAADHQGVDVEITLHLGGAQPAIIRLQSEVRTEKSTLIGAFQDVTALREFEYRAYYLSEHDELTDLPHRRLFKSLFNERVANAAYTAWSITVIDITGLFRVNALLGIAAGDQVVAAFAQRLRQSLGADDLIARLEADTFAVASPVDDRERLMERHHQWLAPLARSHSIAGQELFTDFSAGASLYPDDATDADVLIRNAQLAQQFNRARRDRRRVILYQDTEAFDDTGLLGLENDIRKALAHHQFFLVYQLQQALTSGEFTGAEALLRWHHPVHGIVSPGQFIPMLEENGLIIEVGEWVIESVCRQLAIWQRAGVTVAMGVNLSAKQFEQDNLAERIMEIASHHGIDPGALELEITENMAMRNPKAALRALQQLRSAGFRLAMDDFGTGQASYEYLLRFPINTIKIDRMFITSVAENRRNRAVIRSITSLALGLGLLTIAEGVETERQHDYLDALDVDEVQGFLISQPVDADHCFSLLQKKASRRGNAAGI